MISQFLSSLAFCGAESGAGRKRVSLGSGELQEGLVRRLGGWDPFPAEGHGAA